MVEVHPAALIGLCHHRWAIPILAELHREDGARFVTLVQRLGLSRDALSRTLQVLIAQGLVMKNPGHGHPLRPEYVLTPVGMLGGGAALGTMRVLREGELEELGLRKWTLPVVYALWGGAERFSELLALPGITGRALSLTLSSLEAAGLLRREARSEWPLVAYRLTDRAAALARQVAELASGLETGQK